MFKRQSVREFDPPGRQSFRDFEEQLRRGRRAAATHDGRIARNRGDLELTWEQALAALAALEGSRVSVRVVESSNPAMLLAVTDGILGPVSRAKHPAFFWPVGISDGDREKGEEHGFYLRRDHFEGAVGRRGNSVLVISQASVVITIRRSEPASQTAVRPI
jgi:hypothetical protein